MPESDVCERKCWMLKPQACACHEVLRNSCFCVLFHWCGCLPFRCVLSPRSCGLVAMLMITIMIWTLVRRPLRSVLSFKRL